MIEECCQAVIFSTTVSADTMRGVSDLTANPLPEPVFYFPPGSGRYTVSPALSRLATNFGNGERDGLLFQIDHEFSRFRTNGLEARRSHPERHILREGFDSEAGKPAVQAMARLMAKEHPECFRLREDSGGFRLESDTTGETIRTDTRGRLLSPLDTGYTDTLDALCGQVQEDLAIVQRLPDGSDRIIAINVCAPSRWEPEKKIGRNFDTTHAPVPGMEKIRTAARGLTEAMVERPASVRFTWGIEFSDRLNLHPLTERDDPGARRGFSPDTPPEAQELFLRVERQVIYGLPDAGTALFLIRPYIYPLREILCGQPERRDALIAALHSMSEASRDYKGLQPATFDAVLRWLKSVPV